jgi:hypothetical protein
MKSQKYLGILIIAAVFCLANILVYNATPVKAAGPQNERLPYLSSWGNSNLGGTGASKGTWGNSNIATGCASAWGDSTWIPPKK